jgi:hypothetical protein
MNEMRKRVAAILEFVNRAEEDRNRTVGSNHEGNASVTEATVPDGYKSMAASAVHESDFRSLESQDMLRTLKARLVSWEDEYGRYPR